MDAFTTLSYEEAFEKLEQSVNALQDRHLDLDHALKYYEEGMKLAQYCHDLLQKAELRVQQLRVMNDGKLESEPLDLALRGLPEQGEK
ncbi:MAG TPA: exodeoxyribonuclease VII small subunit [Ktedonobacteraceae bacterium]